MKKFLHYLVFAGVIFFSSPLLFAQTSTPPSGNGTSVSPYLVESLENLYWISQNSQHWDKYYLQTENIDASATQFWNAGEGWEPIGNSDAKFTGNYDGGGNIIKNLYINRPEPEDHPVNWYQALFGYIEDATITNLGVIDADITGYYYVAALVGRNDNSLINKCFTSGIITGDWNIGGLSGGSFDESIIEKCYSTGEIYGIRYVGGLVGYNNATLNNSYSNANSFESVYYYSGGLVGINHNYGIINDSYSTGFVSDAGNVSGGLVGRVMEDGQVNNSYWNTETSGQDESDGGEGKTTAEMMELNTFADWDFEHIWDIIENETYPFLVWQDGPGSHNYPYKHELKLIADPEEGGTQSGAGFYLPGETVEISAYSNDGYFFINWTGDTSHADDPDATSTDVTIPDYDITLIANYLPITMTIEIEPAGAGNVSIDPDKDIYFEGDAVTLAANPDINEGYVFDNWSIEETVIGYENEIEYIMPDTAVTITASFKDAFAGGKGTEQEPWLIETAEQLNNVRNYLGVDHVDKHFEQIADINLNIEPYNEGEGWLPIGHDYFNQFRGTYNGGEYYIDGLYINRPEDDELGLFGYIGEGAYIENIILKNVDITGKNHVGSLAGYVNKTFVFNCSSGGSVTGNNNTGGLIGTVNAPWQEQSIIEQSSSSTTVTGNENVGGLIGIGQGGINNTIRIENCYATGDVAASGSNVGGLVGSLAYLDENSGIFNSYSTGNVSGEGSRVGGLIGDNPNVIKKSFSTGDVTGQAWHTGGFVGANFGTINNSYSTGNVNGTNIAGGFVGSMQAGSSTNNSYSTGHVDGENNIGGFSGSLPSDATIDNCYWNTETSGLLTSEGGQGKLTTELMVMDTFDEWDFDEIWQIVENETYPYFQWQHEPGEHNSPELYELTIIVNPEGAGTITGDGSRPAGGFIKLSATIGEGAVFINWTDEDNNELGTSDTIIYEMPAENVTVYANFDVRFAGGFGTEEQPWLIETPEHLDNIRHYLGWDNRNKHFKQNADINLDVSPWNEDSGWEPIGNTFAFSATFDGNDHIIEGLFINRPGEFDVGLFKATDDYAYITNVHLTDVDITGYQKVGALIGDNRRSTIEMSSSSGIVKGNSRVGGLVGFNQNHAIIKQSFSKAECHASFKTLGGLVGENTFSSLIESSYSTGIVIGEHDEVGGLVGLLSTNSTIENCYSIASVRGRNDVGGLVGRLAVDYESLKNSYSTGRVIGESNIGGLVGRGSEDNVENSFWDIIVSDIEISAAGEGKTTDEMTTQDTFTDWDFDDTWDIFEDFTYPYLQWQTDINHNAPPEFFELTLLTNPENAGTAEGEGEYPENNLIELTATPYDGYYLENWTDDDNEIVGEDEVIFYTMPSKNTTLTANFAPIDYEINLGIHPEEGGSVEFEPEQEYYHVGQEVTLTAIPEEGYEFFDWSGTFSGDDPVLQFVMPSNDIFIHVSFNLGQYELILESNPENGGWTGLDPWQNNYNFGDIITITANAYDNYEFKNWTDDDDNVISEQESYDYSMPAHDVILTANFDFADSTEDLAQEGIKVFPNPATNMFSVESHVLIKQVKLIDITGQVSKNLVVNDFQTRLNVTNLKTGIYFIQIHTEETVITKRVQIAR